MGKFSRMKGYRGEAGIVNALKAAGIVEAQRIPLSGGAGGQFSGDIAIGPRRYESKVRADGFKQLYAALADHDGLFVNADRKQLLVVLPFREFVRLMKGGSNG
jgi:hypothetical protein